MSSPQSDIEVEMKFRLPDPERLRTTLRSAGARCRKTIEQTDSYFAHPSRDFAQTDEALRVRRIGDEGRVTYKGPLRDAETKSRQEIELQFAGGAEDANRCGQMLTLLGFKHVLDVRKSRETWQFEEEGREFEIVIDDVAGLGTFTEIETTASEVTFDAAKQAVIELAKRFQLGAGERKSYLAMLLGRGD